MTNTPPDQPTRRPTRRVRTLLPTGLQAGVDTAVIALWFGHADIRSTNVYLHADMTIKQRALELATHRPPPHRAATSADPLLAFLEGL
jgi:hypothetical protein